jgi:hypothetical protein
MVARESEKCRSNRSGEHLAEILPGVLRGERPRAFGSEEGVADESHGNVMVPARRERHPFMHPSPSSQPSKLGLNF